MKITKLILAAAAVLALTGCGHKRAADIGEPSGTQPSLPSDTASVFTGSAAEYALYTRLVESYKPWHALQMPITLSLLAPERMSISGRCTMVRDSIIHMSLRLLGMEVAVVQLTADSIIGVDKFNKVYIAESLKNVAGSYPITLGNIQDLLLGQAFVPGGQRFGISAPTRTTPTTPNLVAFCDDDANWWCTIAEAEVPYTRFISLVRDADSYIECTYSDFASTQAGPVASQVDISTCIKTGKLSSLLAKAKIQWRPDKAVWTNIPAPQFSIPRGCRRVDAVAFIKTF